MIIDAYVQRGDGRSLSGPTSGLDDVTGKPLLIVLRDCTWKENSDIRNIAGNLRQLSKNCVGGKNIVLNKTLFMVT